MNVRCSGAPSDRSGGLIALLSYVGEPLYSPEHFSWLATTGESYRQNPLTADQFSLWRRSLRHTVGTSAQRRCYVKEHSERSRVTFFLGERYFRCKAKLDPLSWENVKIRVDWYDTVGDVKVSDHVDRIHPREHAFDW